MIPSPRKEINVIPEIDYNFKEDGFIARAGILPSFSRSHFHALATVVNKDGEIVLAEENEPRIQYSFENPGECLGLLLEPEVLNYAPGLHSGLYTAYSLVNVTDLGPIDSPAKYGSITARVYQITGSNSRITSFLEDLYLLGEYFTVSIYLKHISGEVTQGNLIDVIGITEGDYGSLPASELIQDGKWHRYSLTCKPGPEIIIRFLTGINQGVRIAAFGDQAEQGRQATSLIPTFINALFPPFQRKADILTLPFDGSEPTSEGAMSIGFIPLDDSSNIYRLYPLLNAEEGGFPELEIGGESNFEIEIVSDESWIAYAPSSGLTNQAVHADESPQWTHSITGAIWIWRTFLSIVGEPVVELTTTIHLPEEPTSAIMQIAADDNYNVVINNIPVASGVHAYLAATTYTDGDVLKSLKKGDNEIKVIVTNVGGRAGLLFKINISCKPQ
jgi:hypothetical protein